MAKSGLTGTLDCIPEVGIRQIASAKKAQASETLDRWFASPETIPASDFGMGVGGVIDAAVAAKIAAWVPQGMEFKAQRQPTTEDAANQHHDQPMSQAA